MNLSIGNSAPIQRKLTHIYGRLVWIYFGQRLKRENARNAAFDLKYGTDTAAEVQLTDMGLSSASAILANRVYRVFWERNFKAVMDDLEIDHRAFTFIDIGAGKGKLLLMAAAYPFRRVIGIELAPGLCRIAERNVAVFKPHATGCRDLEVIEADALACELPPGPLVCLMQNPFEMALLGEALDRLAAQARARPDPVYIVYANMRRVSEMDPVLATRPGLGLLVRRRNHIIWRSTGGRGGRTS